MRKFLTVILAAALALSPASSLSAAEFPAGGGTL